MSVIYYYNVPDELLKTLSLPEHFRFKEWQIQKTAPGDANLFLIGEGAPHLVQTIVRLTSHSPYLGVIVLPSTPHSSKNLSMSFRFVPKMSQHVKVAGSLNADELKGLIVHEADLTKTRRAYKTTSERALSKVSFTSSPLLKSHFFDQFVSQAPVGVVLLSKSHIVIDANEKIEQLFRDDFTIGSTYFPDMFRESKAIVEKLLEDVSAQSDPGTLEASTLSEGSSHLQLHISEVHSVNTMFHMVIVMDVTREVVAERKMQDYMRELENHNKELEQFANILAHDLKGPLSTIQVSGEVAQNATNDQKNHLLEVICRSATNLHQMIEGLEAIIDVRKNTSSKATMVEFQAIFDNVLSAYQLEMETKQIAVATDFKQASAITYIESYLTSIFSNLISNAVKYRKEEEPLEVIVETQRHGEHILLKVADNGIGMDVNKHKAQLFQPFRRFTNHAQGRGVGLSIIKAMIEKNEGKISVESSLGEGTTFYCLLKPYD